MLGHSFNSHSSDVPAPPIFDFFIVNVELMVLEALAIADIYFFKVGFLGTLFDFFKGFPSGFNGGYDLFAEIAVGGRGQFVEFNF